jgi:thiol-disulfide isomerase/thioredoxin
MRYVLFILLLGFQMVAVSQQPAELIAKILHAQQTIKHIRAYITRHDTLVTGHIRTMKGWVNATVDPADRIFGFRFYAVPEEKQAASIYDGHSSFFIDHQKKEFEKFSDPEMLDAITGKAGGQLIWKDMIRIDTSTATGFQMREDDQFYYLRILLPDITRYDVIKRSKELTISKKNFLPIAIRQHQETLGKVQDLYFINSEIQINEEGIAYDFSKERYPSGFKEEEKVTNKKQLALQGKKLPGFKLTGFDGSTLLSDDLKGKLVLLDFWEVWCGPCIESMPRVKALYEKYKSTGLEVIGIIHQTEHLKTARQLVEKIKPGFKMALGNEQMKNDFSIQAVPLYILINRSGNIVLLSEGFPEILEETIRTNL